MDKLSPELDGKMRQFNRLLLSWADFKHAKLASAYILTEHLHDRYPAESRVLIEALNCSMIMAYCRPFSGNDGSGGRGVPDLPHRFLRVLNDAERRLHDVVMQDRNQVLAHSDADALQLEAVVHEGVGGPSVIPVKNWGLAPLTFAATATFHSAAEKLLGATVEERVRLEPELIAYLPKAEPDGGS